MPGARSPEEEAARCESDAWFRGKVSRRKRPAYGGVDGGSPGGRKIVPWVVDTCLLIDIADADVRYGAVSSRLLASRQAQGLVISPVSYVELAPAFHGMAAAQ